VKKCLKPAAKGFVLVVVLVLGECCHKCYDEN